MHAPIDYVERRNQEREVEKQRERQKQEAKRIEQEAIDQANAQSWFDWFAKCFEERFKQYLELYLKDYGPVLRDEVIADTWTKLRKEYNPRLDALEAKVKTLEQQASFDQKFFDLEHRLDARNAARDEAKRGSEIPHSEFLVKIESLRRQVDDLRVADLDVRELAERVGELEKTNSLEARFTKLLNEAKGGPEIHQNELRAKIEKLQCQIDDLNKVAAQPGPQGPPGKLPHVKEYAPGCVHYDAEVVVHAGALWQASSDTVHPPPPADWICIARAGRDGCDGRSPNVCGPYDAREKYHRLDVVALDGAAFIARRDDPGICPGDGWQLLSRQGRSGNRGESGERGVRGEKGERGEPGATIVSWQLDRERYRISPLMSDGKVGPNLELRALFEQFLSETSED